MIKVLHIIKSLNRGGAEMLLSETLKHHDRNKFEFHYCIFSRDDDDLVNEIEKNGGQIFLINSKCTNLKMFFSIFQISHYVKINNISILHCHMPLVGVLGRVLRSLWGYKLIYTEHNLQESYKTITRYLNKITFIFQDQVLACSDEVLKSIKDNIKHKPKLGTLKNCVDIDKFNNDSNSANLIRKKYRVDSGVILIGTIVSFRAQKRLKLWLDIACDISKKYSNVRFMMVGGGPLDIEINDYKEKYNIDCIMTGTQSNTTAYYAAFDIFFMTSEYEGLPLALLEAMSSECAVVTTGAGGIGQVVEHKKNGLVADVYDNSAIKDNLIEMINDSSLRRNCAANARITIVERFSIENMVSQLEEIYTRL
ncbi:glycosyltransferase [Francisellaceae bacterium]|nr:glycosyltransferase [Francisellaceae bacterium]